MHQLKYMLVFTVYSSYRFPGEVYWQNNSIFKKSETKGGNLFHSPARRRRRVDKHLPHPHQLFDSISRLVYLWQGLPEAGLTGLKMG